MRLLIILIILSLLVMTTFMIIGIVKILKNGEGKKLLITGMLLGIIPVVLTTIVLFIRIS